MMILIEETDITIKKYVISKIKIKKKEGLNLYLYI